MLRLHCFLCASPLFTEGWEQDHELHLSLLRKNVDSLPEDDVLLTVIQNGCDFPTGEIGYIRNPIVKSVAYNWLLCDANCQGNYWLFLPEDCYIKPYGWEQIKSHMNRGKECFTLSRDPKSLICKRGIFQNISKDLQALCDMNFLGKEIGCVVLREELDQKRFHCITKTWKQISKNPDHWDNELYKTINITGQKDSNEVLRQPTLQDYGFDGWKTTKEELEQTFMKIVSKRLDLQKEQANKLKGLIAYYGPLISKVPYKGLISDLVGRIKDKLS